MFAKQILWVIFDGPAEPADSVRVSRRQYEGAAGWTRAVPGDEPHGGGVRVLAGPDWGDRDRHQGRSQAEGAGRDDVVAAGRGAGRSLGRRRLVAMATLHTA